MMAYGLLTLLLFGLTVVEEIVKDLKNIVEITMSVPTKHHRHLFAQRCEDINQISTEYSGATVTNPQFNLSSTGVLIKGHKDFVEKDKNKINNIAEEGVTVDVIIPQKMHTILMRNRDLLEGMRRDLDVLIKFPERPAKNCQYNRKPEDVNVGKKNDENCAPSVNDIVTILGKPENCESAKQILVDNKPKIIEMTIESEFHSIIIGKYGKIVRELHNKYGVHVNLPREGDRNKVTVVGYLQNAESARDEIQVTVDKLKNVYKEEIYIDNRIVPRLIGNRRSNISKIMDRYHVDICISKADRSNPDLITIYAREDATHDDVLDCMNSLEIIQEDYLVELLDKTRAINNNSVQCITVEIPQITHQVIMRNRVLLRGMRRDLDVLFKFPKWFHGAKNNRKPDDVNIKKDTDKNCASNPIDIVTIYGKPENCESAKQILVDNVPKIIEMAIEPVFHPMIIGKNGETVRGLINKYDVQVNLPREGNRNNENKVTVAGYQQTAESARDEIQEIVDKFKNVYKEEICIDSRVHSRLIGRRGRNISKIMDKYHVDICVSKADSSNPDLITIFAGENATHNDVLDCMNSLKMLQQYYLNEIFEYQARANLTTNL